MKWRTEGLPLDSEPVLLKVGSTIQHITYELVTIDLCGYKSFHPYYFETKDDLEIPVTKVTAWIYIDDLEPSK